MRSVKNKEPENIQPYYRAWMIDNPEQPRAWEKDWKNNIHFSSWIHDKHFEFKRDVLKRNMDDYFEKHLPYNEEQRKIFMSWLYNNVMKHKCTCGQSVKDHGFCTECDVQKPY